MPVEKQNVCGTDDMFFDDLAEPVLRTGWLGAAEKDPVGVVVLSARQHRLQLVHRMFRCVAFELFL